MAGEAGATLFSQIFSYLDVRQIGGFFLLNGPVCEYRHEIITQPHLSATDGNYSNRKKPPNIPECRPSATPYFRGVVDKNTIFFSYPQITWCTYIGCPTRGKFNLNILLSVYVEVQLRSAYKCRSSYTKSTW